MRRSSIYSCRIICQWIWRGTKQRRGSKWYRKAAEQGDADAQNSLGYYYERGEGVAKDLGKAIEWYRKSADNGNELAQCNLGLCYECGKGVTKDLVKAAEWYQKAAEQGSAVAQNRLGECYFYGRGEPENKSAAVKWYEKAAEQGIANAQYNLGYCYEKGIRRDKRQRTGYAMVQKKRPIRAMKSAKEAIDRMESGGMGAAVAGGVALAATGP